MIEQINDKELAILKSRTDISFLPIRQILLINNEIKLINPLEYPQKGLLRSDGYFVLGVAYNALISKDIDNLKFLGNTEQTESIKKVLKLAFEKR